MQDDHQPTDNPVSMTFHCDRQIMEEVNEYRFSHRHASKRSALEALLRIGLEAEKNAAGAGAS